MGKTGKLRAKLDVFFESEKGMKMKAFFDSKYNMAMQLVLSSVIMMFPFAGGFRFVYVAALVIFIVLISLALLACDDLFHTFLPFMILTMTFLKCYNSFDIFIWCLPLGAVPIMAMVYHFNKYKVKYKYGLSFRGMMIYAVAVTLGGVGLISAEAYFSLTAVYYTFGLGFGMVYLYLIVNSRYRNDEKNTLGERFADAMTVVSAFASVMVITHYIQNISEFLANPGILQFQWRNNISTYMMLAMPFPFYLSQKKWGYIFVGILNYVTLLLAGSRGGMLFGTVEFLICIAIVLFMDKKHRKINLIFAGIIVAVPLCFSKQLYEICYVTIQRFLDYDENKIRLELFKRAILDFKANPITGSGLANWNNTDIHESKRFALCWYHSSPFQVLGSFGMVGVIAYLIRLGIRAKIIFSRFNFFTAIMACSFLGLLMMSLVNPGEFCPLPYEFIVTIIFIILEKTPEKKSRKEKRLAKK